MSHSCQRIRVLRFYLLSLQVRGYFRHPLLNTDEYYRVMPRCASLCPLILSQLYSSHSQFNFLSQGKVSISYGNLSCQAFCEVSECFCRFPFFHHGRQTTVPTFANTLHQWNLSEQGNIKFLC